MRLILLALSIAAVSFAANAEQAVVHKVIDGDTIYACGSGCYTVDATGPIGATMSSAPDFDYIIHQDLPRPSKGEHCPMTVGAIIQHLGRQKADRMTDNERAYLRAFSAAKEQAGFIEDQFLSIAVGDGRTLRSKTFKVGGEEGGWFGINRFFGLYVVSFSQYGEGETQFGPFRTRSEANAVFGDVVAMNTPLG